MLAIRKAADVFLRDHRSRQAMLHAGDLSDVDFIHGAETAWSIFDMSLVENALKGLRSVMITVHMNRI